MHKLIFCQCERPIFYVSEKRSVHDAKHSFIGYRYFILTCCHCYSNRPLPQPQARAEGLLLADSTPPAGPIERQQPVLKLTVDLHLTG